MFSIFPENKLSTMTTPWPGRVSSSTIWEPINPAPPVTMYFMAIDSCSFVFERDNSNGYGKKSRRPGPPVTVSAGRDPVPLPGPPGQGVPATATRPASGCGTGSGCQRVFWEYRTPSCTEQMTVSLPGPQGHLHRCPRDNRIPRMPGRQEPVLNERVFFACPYPAATDAREYRSGRIT